MRKTMLRDAYILALREAYLQLDWGTDPDAMAVAAASLEAIDPSHDVLRALSQRMHRARTVSQSRPQSDRSPGFVRVGPPQEDRGREKEQEQQHE